MPHGRSRELSESDRGMIQIPMNPEPDETCRTIKANYQRMSVANFIRRGGYGATGVIIIENDGK